MAVSDASGFPVAAHIESASPHEVKLVEDTLDQSFIKKPLQKLIGDKAYDSDGLDQKLMEDSGIDMIAPHRKNRKIKTQDGPKLRRYKRRWKVGVSSKGHIVQSVKVRPGLKGSDPVAREAPWRESKMVKPSDKLFRKETMQGFRPQRTVNVDVASLHATPVAETVDNARRQQEPLETSPMRRFSPAGYQRWHVARDYVSTGETLGVRRRNLVEEALSITVSGKWERRRQGGGSGCSTVDRCAAKRTGRKGPEPVNAPFDCSEAGVK